LTGSIANYLIIGNVTGNISGNYQWRKMVIILYLW